MEKKVTLLLAIFCFYLSLVSAGAAASSNSSFTLRGCTSVPGDPAGIFVGDCSTNGEWYCAGIEDLQSTLNDGNACSYGRGTVLPPACCPGTGSQECRNPTTEDSSTSPDGSTYNGGLNYCFAATKDCGDYATEGECEGTLGDYHGGQCYWYESGQECVPSRRRCSDYGSETTCNADSQNVAKDDSNCRHGETVVAGTAFVIPEDSCECVWNDDKKSCALNFTIKKVYACGILCTSDDQCNSDAPTNSVPFPDTDGVCDTSVGQCNCVPAVSTCQYILEQGNCTNGVQDYFYRAAFNQDDSHQNLLAGDALCFERSGKWACGDEVVKVPFFSFINVLVVVLLVLLFYVFRIKSPTKGKKGKK